MAVYLSSKVMPPPYLSLIFFKAGWVGGWEDGGMYTINSSIAISSGNEISSLINGMCKR